MYIFVTIIHIALFKSRWGLRTRAVGEHPTAAESVGINVNAVRFKNVILAGAIAGLGGAFFTLGAVGSFSKEMTAGKGFIALAALIFGRWSPMGAVAAALIFGFADNLQGLLTIIGTPIPSEFMLMAPYIATIIAVSGFIGKVRAPAADGIPYKRGGGSH
jgi:simple sugar transport system permease protein